MFSGDEGLRRGPAPLTLGSLGRWGKNRGSQVIPSAHEEARMDDFAGAGSTEPTAGFPKTGDPDMDHLNELLSLVRTYDDLPSFLRLLRSRRTPSGACW